MQTNDMNLGSDRGDAGCISKIVKKKPKFKPPPRLHLACIQCTKRKVKCDKNIPCSTCIKRNQALECRRGHEKDKAAIKEEEAFNDVNSLTSRTPETLSISNLLGETLAEPTETDLVITESAASSSIEESSYEDYLNALRSISFGLSKISGLRAPDSLLNHPKEYHRSKLALFLKKLDFSISTKICTWSCQNTTLLHQSILMPFFIEDHKEFWDQYALIDINHLYYWKDNKLSKHSPSDYYYWMALYYMVLCTGMYFGQEELSLLVPFSTEEFGLFPSACFHAAINCLFEAKALYLPDIRFVQIYGIIAICAHAFGNISLDSQLLNIAITTAKSLDLDKIEDINKGPLSFQKEIAKRLWYNLYIIDSYSSLNDNLIRKFKTSIPRLVTLNQLLSVDHNDFESDSGDNQTNSQNHDDEYFMILYQRILIKMAEIRKESKMIDSKGSRNSHITKAWSDMNVLRNDLDKYFNSDLIKNSSQEYGTAEYAKYLLKSYLSRESMELCIRLLQVVGKNHWFKYYRSSCIDFAVSILRENASKKVPSFYKRHWIISHHLIHASMLILVDILTVGQDHESAMARERIEMIGDFITSIENSKNPNYTTRLGILVISKLFRLVSKVLDNSLEDSESIELRRFLKELKMSTLSSNEFQFSKGIQISIPSINSSHYLRSLRNVTTGNNVPQGMPNGNNELPFDGNTGNHINYNTVNNDGNNNINHSNNNNHTSDSKGRIINNNTNRMLTPDGGGDINIYGNMPSKVTFNAVGSNSSELSFPNYAPFRGLDFEMDSIFDDSGWQEFFRFFFAREEE